MRVVHFAKRHRRRRSKDLSFSFCILVFLSREHVSGDMVIFELMETFPPLHFFNCEPMLAKLITQ